MIAAEMGVLELIIEELRDDLPILITLESGKELEDEVWKILSFLSDDIITCKNTTVVVSEEVGGLYYISSIFKSKPELNWKKGDLLVPKLARVVSSFGSFGFELWFDNVPFGTVFEIIEYDGSEDVYCRDLKSRKRMVIPVHYLKKAVVFGGGMDE